VFLVRRFTGASGPRAAAVAQELNRYICDYVNLLASTSYPFPDTLTAMGLPMSLLPVEGMAGRRYFPGSQLYDELEGYGEHLVRRLFNLTDEYGATLQPHSGTQANQIVFNSVLEPDDVVLSLRPADGGHISHTVLIGRRNRVVHCGIGSNGLIDYNEIKMTALRERPKLMVIGSSSYPREINFEKLGEISKACGAYLHADISHTALFVAGHIHSHPAPHADFLTFNTSKNLRGPNAGVVIFRSNLRKKLENAVFPGTQGGPHESAILAKVVTFENLLAMDFCSYALHIQTNARRFSDALIKRGAAVVTGGTDCHIVLVNLTNLGITGLDAEKRLENSKILANRNQISGDPKPPWIASGVRFGLACATILEYTNEEIDILADASFDAILGNDVSLELGPIIAHHNLELIAPQRSENEDERIGS
jgi:glycine hydroxymethyltransferase